MLTLIAVFLLGAYVGGSCVACYGLTSASGGKPGTVDLILGALFWPYFVFMAE
jgi:hypothetical protein